MSDNKRNPSRWSSLLRPALFSLAMAAGIAVISTGLYLVWPSPGGAMAIGLVMTIPLALVCRVWGCGSAGLAAIWLTGLLAIAGTIALEAGTCYILFTMGLFGPHGTISMACSANYLLGARFGHILMGSLFIVVVWVDMLVRRKQRKQERPR